MSDKTPLIIPDGQDLNEFLKAHDIKTGPYTRQPFPWSERSRIWKVIFHFQLQNNEPLDCPFDLQDIQTEEEKLAIKEQCEKFNITEDFIKNFQLD